MTEPKKRRSLLLGFVSPPERVIEAADAAIEDFDTDLPRRAGGPDIDLVPAEHLPARAWGRSVDVWDPVWPEAIKRAVIVAAPQVHERKGTVYAVKTALAALGVDAAVIEWWQEVPKAAPYTFTVKAYARARLYDGPLLDARLIRVVFASVLRAKPESRAFDLVVGANLPARAGLAPVLIGKCVLGRAAVPRPRTGMQASLGVAPVLVGKVRVSRAFVPALPAT